MFYVYILKSLKNNKRYVGLTSVLPEERLKQHNSGSNTWSKGNKPFELVYSEEYSDKEYARKREGFLKTGNGRRVLDKLLRNNGGCSSIG